MDDLGRPVRELYAAVNRHDADAFDRLISDEIEFTVYGLNETFRGKEAFKKYFKMWWRAFPEGKGEIRNLIASNEQAIAEILGRGTQSGPFETSRGTIEPSNRMLELHFCQVFRIQNGLIVSGRSYSDAYGMLGIGAEVRKAA